MAIGPTLETARLILRPPIQADFEGFAAMGQEEDTMRFIGGVRSRDESWRWMAALTGAWALLGYSMFSVLEKQSGRWIGRLGPWRPGGKQGGWPGDEIAWGLRRDAQGKGYASEGATAAIDWAFEHLGWESVIHCILAENAPSIALAQRLGSTRQRVGVALPAPLDTILVDIYGLTKTQWRARQRAARDWDLSPHDPG
jgi:RimJ/RimL family protein N-acetyltransferase